MLSNTATPKYYGQFRDAVLSGRVPINEYVALEMARIDERIADPEIYYDDKAIDGFIEYCEQELTLTDGSDLVLLDTFKLWAEQLLSWFYFIKRKIFVPNQNGIGGKFEVRTIKKRLINKQYIIVARGGAKSMYASVIQSYFLNIVAKTTYQVTVAPTLAQAEEVLSPIRTSITRARGPLFQLFTNGSIYATKGSRASKQILASTKKGIENFSTGSLLEARPMSIDKLQGLRVTVASIDEWLSGDSREDVGGALEQGAAKEQNSSGANDYTILYISSEGTVRNGAGDDIKLRLLKTLKGEYNDPHSSIFWYCLDDISEVAKPELWLKANPNLGITVTYQTYHLDVEKAEKDPSSRNDILAKRFGLPMEGYTYFFTYEETLPHRIKHYRNMLCSLGCDLSQGDDFCAFTFLFPLRDGTFGVKTRSYISSLTLDKLPGALHNKYLEFINEGSLIVLEGSILDMHEVYEDLMQHIEKMQYTVICMGYDPYNAEEFIKQWSIENSSWGMHVVRQGARTESVPLGEIKKLAESRMLRFDELIMQFTMGNSMVEKDNNGNKKLYKKNRASKIDNVAALLDAFVAFKLHREDFN